MTDYDIADATKIGSIHRLTVMDIDGREHPVKYEDALEVQEFTLSKSSRPMCFCISDDIIRLSPAPLVATYPTMVMLVELADTKLVNDADITAVDTEALTAAATIKLRDYLGVGGPTAGAKAELGQYLLDLRGLVSPNRSYPIASRFVDGPAYWRQPSVNAYSSPYSPDWNPW